MIQSSISAVGLLTGLLFTSFLCASNGVRIMLQDSAVEIANYYSRVGAGGNTSSGTQSHFNTLGDEAKKNLCIESFKAVRFSFEPNKQGERVNIEDELEGKIQEIKDYYENTEISRPDTVTVAINFHKKGKKRNIQELKGIPCLPVPQDDYPSWVIENGSNANHFYVVGNGIFLGLVEEVTTVIDNEIGTNEENLKEALKNSEEMFRFNGAKNIHLLDSFNRARACASAYMAWTEASTGVAVDNKFQNFVRESRNNNNIFLPFFSISRPTHAIPCNVNGTWKDIVFYLAADFTETGAAFLFTFFSGEPKNRPNQLYKLDFRLRGVLGLETL